MGYYKLLNISDETHVEDLSSNNYLCENENEIKIPRISNIGRPAISLRNSDFCGSEKELVLSKINLGCPNGSAVEGKRPVSYNVLRSMTRAKEKDAVHNIHL